MTTSLDGECTAELSCAYAGDTDQLGSMRIVFRFSNSTVAQVIAQRELAEDGDDDLPEREDPVLEITGCFRAPTDAPGLDGAAERLHQIMTDVVPLLGTGGWARTDQGTSTISWADGRDDHQPQLLSWVGEQLTLSQTRVRDWGAWASTVAQLYANCCRACGVRRPAPGSSPL